MKLRLQDGLPYATATISYGGQSIDFHNVLIDTGSAGTIFSTDNVLALGLTYAPDDPVHRIRGVGGAEFVFTKRVDRLGIGDLQVDRFEIEIGAMEYGFDLDGIVGMDFLTSVGAVLDLAQMEIGL